MVELINTLKMNYPHDEDRNRKEAQNALISFGVGIAIVYALARALR